MNPLQRSLRQVTVPEEVKARTKSRLSAAREEKALRSAAPRLIAACACLLLAVLCVGGWQMCGVPVSYISIDVNPSVELALNRLGQVVGTAAYNDGGEEVLDGLSLQGHSYTQAIDTLLSSPQFQRYLGQDGKVVFTVVSDSAAQLKRGLQSLSSFLECDSEYYRADFHCLEQAHANGLSVGKYRIYEALSQYDSTVTMEDCHHMTIGELQDELARCSGHGSHHSYTPSTPAPSASAPVPSASAPVPSASAPVPSASAPVPSASAPVPSVSSSPDPSSGQGYGHGYGHGHGHSGGHH